LPPPPSPGSTGRASRSTPPPPAPVTNLPLTNKQPTRGAPAPAASNKNEGEKGRTADEIKGKKDDKGDAGEKGEPIDKNNKNKRQDGKDHSNSEGVENGEELDGLSSLASVGLEQILHWARLKAGQGAPPPFAPTTPAPFNVDHMNINNTAGVSFWTMVTTVWERLGLDPSCRNVKDVAQACRDQMLQVGPDFDIYQAGVPTSSVSCSRKEESGEAGWAQERDG
jgi:hypothetical protein